MEYLLLIHVAGIVPTLIIFGIYFAFSNKSPIRALPIALLWMPLALAFIAYVSLSKMDYLRS